MMAMLAEGEGVTVVIMFAVSCQEDNQAFHADLTLLLGEGLSLHYSME